MIHEFNFSIEDGKNIDRDVLSMLAGLMLRNFDELDGQHQEALRLKANENQDAVEWEEILDITYSADSDHRMHEFPLGGAKASRFSITALFERSQSILVVKLYALPNDFSATDIELFLKQSFVVGSRDEALIKTIECVQSALEAWLMQPVPEPAETTASEAE